MGELESVGYKVVRLPGGVPMAVYYDPITGKPTQPMPADPFNMRELLARGFTLTPPIRKTTRRKKDVIS